MAPDRQQRDRQLVARADWRQPHLGRALSKQLQQRRAASAAVTVYLAALNLRAGCFALSLLRTPNGMLWGLETTCACPIHYAAQPYLGAQLARRQPDGAQQSRCMARQVYEVRLEPGHSHLQPVSIHMGPMLLELHVRYVLCQCSGTATIVWISSDFWTHLSDLDL